MKKAQILIVEDDRIVAEDMKNSLEKQGHFVCGIESSGEESLEKIRVEKPDLVLMDIMLKGELNGIETAKQIRSMYDIPIVYVTAYADEEMLAKAKATEPFGYIVKPIQEIALESAIEIALYKHNMEKELKESEKKYRMLVEASNDAIYVETLEGTILDCNNVACEMLGYERDELIGMNVRDLVPEEIAAELPSLLNDDILSGKTRAEALNKKKDGTVFPVEASINISENNLVIVYIRDITDRKRAEEEKLSLELQVQQAQKLESLGVLAGGIAHDFNNLLMGVLGNADLALMDMAPEAPARGRVQDIEIAAKRAADLTRQMLAYSGKGKFIIKSISLQSIVEEMVHLLEVSISKKVVIKYDFAESVPTIEADATQMRQIVMNLVVNASEAIGNRSGVVSIRTGAMDCDKAYLDETYIDNTLPEGAYSYFEVSDTGSGMDEKTVSKIFDPFFTTKFTGRGLGLAAVLGIVRGHKGAIKVYSELGKGATFKVLFPASQSSAAYNDIPASFENDARLKGKTILLVDDEETVRTVGKQMLERLGMEVTTAEDGREALKLFKQAPDQFDCIILDLTMPHMDGEETFREMRRVRKGIRVLLSSGYNEQDLIARFASKKLAGFIQKPYQMASIGAALAKAFEFELLRSV